MTVEELIQKLVELAKEGKGQYRVEVAIGDGTTNLIEEGAIEVQDNRTLVII
jgi:hypothetical protein